MSGNKFFKMVIQKTTDTHSILMAVIENDMLGDLPTICEMEAFMQPPNIYTGTYPTIRINTDTLKPREDLIGMGIAGIATSPIWATKTVEHIDWLGINITKS